MSIRGITFVNQIVKSDDDASLHNMLLSGRSGVMKGCSTTFDSSHIYVTSGQFVILGRQIEVQGTETITPEAVAEGKKYCRLVFEIDLSKINTTETFGQGYFKVLSSSVSYPSVIQEDLTAGGTVYQYPWARFTQTVNGITNFANDTTVLQFSVDDVLSALSENPVQNKVVYEEFEKILDGTQQVGNAKQLGGKDASEYALEEDLTKRQLNYKSATTQDALLTILNDYSANFADGTAYEFYVNVRFSENQLGSGVWHIEGVKTNSNFETQRASLYNGDVKLRGKFDGAWLEWEEIATIADLANYLPLSGGTVGSGSVNRPFKIKGALAPFLEFLNSDDIKVGSIGIASNGEPAIELSDGSLKGILHTGNISSHALPITGGRLTTPTNPAPLYLKRENSDNTILAYEGKSGSLGAIGFDGVDNPIFYSGNIGTQKLHHDGNSAKVAIQSKAPADGLWVW